MYTVEELINRLQSEDPKAIVYKKFHTDHEMGYGYCSLSNEEEISGISAESGKLIIE